MTNNSANNDFHRLEDSGSLLHKMAAPKNVFSTSVALDNQCKHEREEVYVKPELKFSIERILGLNKDTSGQHRLQSADQPEMVQSDNENKIYEEGDVEDQDVVVEDDTYKDDIDAKSSALCDDSSTPRYQWLQCTRYHPPKLHRNKPNKGAGKRKLGRSPRVPFTHHQVTLLEDKYKHTQYLSSGDVGYLSSALQLSDARVKIWFQNRRARDRREKETTQMNEKSILQKTFLPLSVPSVSWPTQSTVLTPASFIPRHINAPLRCRYL